MFEVFALVHYLVENNAGLKLKFFTIQMWAFSKIGKLLNTKHLRSIILDPITLHSNKEVEFLLACVLVAGGTA